MRLSNGSNPFFWPGFCDCCCGGGAIPKLLYGDAGGGAIEKEAMVPDGLCCCAELDGCIAGWAAQALLDDNVGCVGVFTDQFVEAQVFEEALDQSIAFGMVAGEEGFCDTVGCIACISEGCAAVVWGWRTGNEFIDCGVIVGGIDDELRMLGTEGDGVDHEKVGAGLFCRDEDIGK